MIPKFRAWDKEHKIMLVVNNICNLSWESKFIEGYEVVPDPKGKREYELIDRRIDLVEDAILMQSTGLFDINGVEIWEGDVVRFHTPQLTTIGGVVFDKNEACFKVRNDFGGHWVTVFHARYFEVIGNVYEHNHLLNPELLEELK